MELKQLEYFVRVAEAGSFTKAAAILRVAQPVLSRQIRQLEESLQTRLLIRNGRGARVTEEGERLLAQGRAILRRVARAREEISGLRGTVVGRVAIGMPAGVATHLAAPVAKQVRKSFPNLELAITQARSATLQDWLASGRIDLAVLLDVPFTPHVENIHLASNNLVLIQPPSEVETSPIPLAQLRTVPLIMQGQSHAVRTLVEMHLGRLGYKPWITMEIDHLKTVVDLVKAGLGSAIIGARTVATMTEPSEINVRRIIEPELKMTLSLAVPIRHASRAHQVVVDIIKDVSRSLGDVGAPIVKAEQSPA